MSRKQAYPVTQLTGGLDVSIDAIFLLDKASPNLRNVRVDKGLIKKGLGYLAFGTGLPLEGTVMLIDSFPMENGTTHQLMVTPDWVYRYIPTSKTYEKKNPNVTTGAIALTFVAATKKITRGSGSFIDDGFNVGYTITTDATLNPGPFTATVVAALEITVSETVANEGPVTKTATGTLLFTGDEDNQFSAVVTLDVSGNDLFILTNGKDKIRKWDGSGGNFATLGGWSTLPVLAKSLAVFQSRLIGGFIVDAGVICPRRVQWSIAGNLENITGTGSGFVDLADTADWVVALALLKNKLYIFKERSIWELPYIGGTSVFGAPLLRIAGAGTHSPNSIINLGEELLFYGSDNVYLYDGIDLTSIGKNIYPLLYETEKRIVNAAKANRVPSAYIEELKSYQICFPSREREVPSLLAEYNFDTRSWTLRDKEITAFGFYTVPGQDRWMDLVGTWAAQDWNWMEKALPAGAPTTLIGDPGGYVYEDGRITKSTDYMCVETKDWIFAHGERIVEFRIQAKGGPFTLFYSLNQGGSWASETKTFSLSSDWTEYIWHLNLTCQYIRFRLETTAEDLDIKWLEPWYIPRVRSKSPVSS